MIPISKSSFNVFRILASTAWLRALLGANKLLFGEAEIICFVVMLAFGGAFLMEAATGRPNIVGNARTTGRAAAATGLTAFTGKARKTGGGEHFLLIEAEMNA